MLLTYSSVSDEALMDMNVSGLTPIKHGRRRETCRRQRGPRPLANGWGNMLEIGIKTDQWDRCVGASCRRRDVNSRTA